MTLLAKVVGAHTDQECEFCPVRAVLRAELVPAVQGSGRLLVCRLHGRMLMMVMEFRNVVIWLDEDAGNTLNWTTAGPVVS
ncbi:hypothetical protein Acsp03_39500 [Actinomadura sp. NBRC 104412]|uniref:hypothetical protein n=1 Tax=Actinomadura sp. NBRC 104412 TaxID=3032203 RepID=UPI0024A18F7E|nr:hypothetical protein [Actinomadura sp. NBRC 104412]GLZ06484.1 hypothetical protein Acsp03_39500 [Actinomadura sp. NBRC 104412]